MHYFCSFVLLLLFSLNTLVAQSVASSTQFLTSDRGALTEITDQKWSFFVDEDAQTYYIDFANLNFNLSDIRVQNADGEVVWREDVFDLPVDTIYELDLGQFGRGEYTVELRSFTGFMRRTVAIP